MAENGKIMRYERKYLLDKDTAFLLNQRVSYVLPPDSAGSNGKYKVSSVYFDDRYDTALYEKQQGFLCREKLRVRYYNGDINTARLECKQKQGERIHKQQQLLTTAQYEMICKGDYSFIREKQLPSGQTDFAQIDEIPVLDKFYIIHLRRQLRPVVTVDYDRQAYMHKNGNVRITFDTGISAKIPAAGYTFPAISDKHIVMEVKYNNFLPSFIAGLFAGFQLTQQLAISKFCMARLALQGV